MILSLGTNYLLPAVLLNPVLFLHSVNTILSRILTPITVDDAVQPPPYSQLGPSANHPHIDMRQHDNLCWSYTMVMVCAQLVAFGRVNRNRERMRANASKEEAPVSPSTQTEEKAEEKVAMKAAPNDIPTIIRKVSGDAPKELHLLAKHAAQPPVIINGHFVAPERVDWEILR